MVVPNLSVESPSCFSTTRGSTPLRVSGHGLVAPLPAHLSRGGLGLTPQAPAPAPTAPTAPDPVTLGNVGKLS